MDILIAGAGPAGLAASAQFARAGLKVGCLAPEHPAPWPNNYGLWEDDIAGLGLTDCHDRRWTQAIVHTGGETAHRLDRAYLRLDNNQLRDRLMGWANAGGVRWLTGRAETVRHDGRGVTVVDSDGRRHRAGLLVDATGHRPAFVERDGQAHAFQAAYGMVADLDGHPTGDTGLVLMDFRDDFLAGQTTARDDWSAPTFLYAMPLDPRPTAREPVAADPARHEANGEGLFFVEETSLAHTPAVSFDTLKGRLERRLGAAGVSIVGRGHIERCLIPMDNPLPRRDQRVIGFGAAASMVHPATGYQMAPMLRTAPRLADAVATTLGRPGATPAAAARHAWQTIWPDAKVRAYSMWRFGLECLLRFNGRETRQFFDAFFRLADSDWRGYMSGTLRPEDIARVMWRVFQRVPISLKMTLGKSAMGPGAWHLMRAIVE